MAKEPTRFAELPADAQWLDYKNVWVKGSNNANLNKQGLWQSWKPNYLYMSENYDNGQLHGDYLRNFKTGQPAVESHYKEGKLHGKATYYHSDHEANPNMPKTFGGKVRKAEVHYHEGKSLYSLFYDKTGNVVDNFGRPRPANVPAEAHWKFTANQWEQTWEVANYENGLLQGLCLRWSAETGKLIYEATHQQGNVVGVAKAYYKNGELCSETNYQNGDPVSPHIWYRSTDDSLTSGFYDGESPNVWRKEVYYREGERLDTADINYFTKEGTACRKNGLPISTVQLADMFTGEPSAFLTEKLETLLRRWLGDKYKGIDTTKSAALKATFRRFYGRDMPGDLSLYFDLMEAADYPALYGNLHTSPYPFQQLQDWADAGKNMVEMSIRAMQNAYPFDYWMDWLTGSISLDKLWTEHYGNCSMSYLYELDNPNRISAWSHDNPRDFYGIQMLGTFSPDLSTFLYFIFACHAHSRLGAISDNEAMAALTKVRPRANFNYNFINAYPLQLNVNPLWRISVSVERSTAATNLNYTRWIMELLRGELDMNDVFLRAVPKRQLLGITKELETNTNRTFNQYMQWLFMAFFIEHESLASAVAECRQHPALILQQAAELVQQLVDGRGLLGTLHIKTAKQLVKG